MMLSNSITMMISRMSERLMFRGVMLLQHRGTSTHRSEARARQTERSKLADTFFGCGGPAAKAWLQESRQTDSLGRRYLLDDRR